MADVRPALRPVDFDPFAKAPAPSPELPLTEPQSEMWTAASVSPEASCSYNQCFAFAFRGPLRIESLRTALDQVVARHDGLRVAIAPDGSSQRVKAPFPVAIPLLDLSALDPEARRAEIERLLQRECDTPFDLAEGPLLRAFALRESETFHHFVLTAHHIVCDGWSSSVLFADLGRFYVADVAGIPAQIGQAPSYESYVTQQASHEHIVLASADEEYWAAQYPNGAPVLDLPLERPRPATKGFRIGQESLTLGNELYAAVKKTGAKSGATLFATLLAAFEVLVYRLSGQSDFVVGIPFAGQLALEDPALVAHCVNTVPLRARLDPQAAFSSHLRSVRQSLGDAQDHSRLTFGSLVRRLRIPRDPSRTPLVEITFNIDKVGTPFDFGDLTIAGLATPKAYSNFELGLNIVDTGSGMVIECGYNADLFDPSTIRRWLSHFAVVLSGIAQGPETTLDSIPLLTSVEQQEVLHRWNPKVVVARGASLHERFEERAARTPDAGAVTFGAETLSYAELNRRANRLAHHLRDHGVKRGDLVGLRVERSGNTVVGILGILKAGAAYLPMDPAYPRDRIAFMLEDSKVRVVVVDAERAGDFADVAVDAVVVESLPPGSETNPEVGAKADDLAYVLYTSGSTGMPKGCPISHYNVTRLFEATEAWFGFVSDDVWTMFHSYSFDFSVWEIWGALLYGGRVVVIPYWVSRSPEAFLDLLVTEGVTVLNQTPSAFRQLVQADTSREASALGLRYVVFGGEALELQALRPWLDRYGDQRPKLVNMYGITETTVHVTYRPISIADLDGGLGSVIGVPIPDLQVYLLDQRGAPVPLGVSGEMYVGGGGVASGYLNRPELSAQRFAPDRFTGRPGARLYRSGDLARRLANGDLEYLGRIDDQVKIRGFRIEMGEIEAALRECPGVVDAAILAPEAAGGERRLVAYVAHGSEGPPQISDLRKSLEARLPAYMIPAAWAFLGVLPLTPNGKVDRKALSTMDVGVENQRKDHTPPRTETEKVLAEIWSEVLHLARVGVDENFFDLGGHSMLATQVVSRAQRALGVKVTLRSFFDAPTVAGLAENLDAARELGTNGPRIEPRGQVTPCPLAPTQEHLWFLEQLTPGSPAYNILDVIHFGGSGDSVALTRSINELVRRHEVFRTAFSQQEGRPIQVILPAVELALEEFDLSSMGAPDREREWTRLVREQGRKPFDFSRPPLLRATIVHLPKEEHRLLLAVHHIVADERSMELVKEELGRLYDAFSRGLPSPLPDPSLQYADFACWQRQWLGAGEQQRQLAYWKEALEGAPTVLDVPPDNPRPARQSFRGATEAFELPGHLLAKVKSLGREEQASLFMVLEACFAAILHRYTGQEDVLVGTPVSVRTRDEMEGLVGYFLNTLVLRAQFTADLSFRALLRQTRERALGAYGHRDLPFQELVAALAPERSPNRSPLFQVMFVMHKEGVSEVSTTLAGAREIEGETSKFDLTLFVSETNGGLTGLMQYSTDLYEASTIRRLCAHYANLLEAALVDPDGPISRLPLLDEAERRQVVRDWNETAVAYRDGNLCLHQLFEQQAERTPDRVAIQAEEGSLTYLELESRANQLAHFLRRLGVGPGVLVGVAIDRSLELGIGLLGILKAGGAYLPLDPTYPKDRLGFMLDDSRAPVLLTQDRLREWLPPHDARVVALDTDWPTISRESSARAASAITSDGLAYVIYTSGSTGKPKGAMNAHRGIVNQILWRQDVYGLDADDRVLQKTPCSFDVSVWEFFWTLAAGARLVMARPDGHKEPAYLLRTIVEQGITTLHFVPPMLQIFLEEEGVGACVTLRRVFSGGEALTADLRDRFYERLGCELHNLYGPTETAVDVTHWPCRRAERTRIVPIGRPVANTQLYVLDRHLQPLPRGVAGELHVGGVQVGPGYLNRPELTAERFIADPFGQTGTRMYKTGDLARFLPDGNVEYLGRMDHQVKVRGFRIELGEIEAAVAAQPGVRDACVIVREDAPGDRRIVAYIVLDGDLAAAMGRMRSDLRERLPEYMVPAHFVALSALPVASNGKLDRKALPPPDSRSTASASYVAPRTATEIRVAAIFADMLGAETVGAHDDFFDLGGHSLKAVQVVTAIRSSLGVDLALRHLFEQPTVAGLAALVDLLGVGANTTPGGEGAREEIEI